MKEYNVVVIGAGNAGIAAAAALAQQGLKPLVIEQHNLPGGCASSFVRGRFEYDVSLHSMCYETQFRPVLEGMMGLTAQFVGEADEFDIVYVEDGKIHRDHYALSGDMAQQIEENHPGSGARFPELVALMLEMQAAFMAAAAPDADMQAIMAQYPHFAQCGGMTLEQVLDLYDAPPYLRSLISMFWWYLGQKPADAPFPLYSIIAGGEFTEALGFPKETSHEYLAELETIIRKHGGDIWYNTTATRIHTESGAVCGVETAQGDQIKTSCVVCNIDPRAAVGTMLTGADAFKEQFLQKQRLIKENFSFMTIYLGMNASAEELGIRCHHIHITEDLDANKIYDACGSWEGPRTIGILCPNITVPDFSPAGTCVLTISVPVQGSILEGLSQRDYFRIKQEFEKAIIEKVETYLGVDLKSHIEEIETATPATLSRYAGLYNGGLGNIISWPQMQMGRELAETLNNSIKGLSFVGQYVGNLGYQNVVAGYMFGLNAANMMKGGEGK